MGPLVGWITEHMVVVFLLLYIALGIVYREEIFRWDSGEQVDTVEKVTPSEQGHVKPPPQIKHLFRPMDADESFQDRPEPLERLLQWARTEVRKGDVGAAELRYRQASRYYPDKPEAYGELGNLFLQENRLDEAAEAYYQAGLRAQRQGREDKVMSLLKALDRLSPERAEQLRRIRNDTTAPSSAYAPQVFSDNETR